jgi:2-keto-4-pentenoate hydratase/2-oxohepta-3-ene-1,7-dioic acid hydratase in catechol pathway
LQDAAPAAAGKKGKPGAIKYVRFQKGETIAYGILEGNRVRQLSGCLFGDFTKTDTTYELDDVTLLVPTQPTQVIAMAGNYKSHLGEQDTTTTTVTTVTKIVSHKKSGQVESESKTTVEKRVSGTVPELFQTPQPFFKTPSCLLPHGGNIVIPKDAGVVHYEAEMVIVIGKKAKNVSKQKALDYVLGVTCGNDVSARVWQKNDVQWWRAKGSDTFGPCGPCIASGIDYDNLQIQLRLNGEVKQQESTGQLIHDVAGMVSFISRHVTLNPGDLIFTGTPGKTSEIKPGDVVEVELEGVGVLKNNVVAEE